ncbi:hypothetical protein Ppa06_24800 [Planomonospora parontospora subsp. parontospora]|uniref:Uncharacterized protein n=2 Tax=Planomonospora parontospora TaxID=58119 RepID=A0AA37BER1_9ACTN|nr:hypothetical protein GCM10010126_20880 [Planomonospora parontospora]GII08682.1 hypothetical protein Ppa06_24800 [Planomonospora parontospora subsp. parontospora]
MLLADLHSETALIAQKAVTPGKSARFRGFQLPWNRSHARMPARSHALAELRRRDVLPAEVTVVPGRIRRFLGLGRI